MPLCCTVIELLPWQAAVHLLGGFTSCSGFRAVNQCSHPKAAREDVPTLHALRPQSVCPKVLGSAQVLAATSGAPSYLLLVQVNGAGQ